MHPLLLTIINTFTFLLMLLMNFLGSTGKLTNATVGTISDKFNTLVTPPGFAFSIWGIIYIYLSLFLGYQWYLILKKKDTAIIKTIGLLFALSNLVNMGWIIIWVNELISISVVIIFLLLVLLLLMVLKLNMEKWDAPITIIFFVWWPISIYLGWVIIACVINVAAYFVSEGWNGKPLSPQLWSILSVTLLTIIYLCLIYFRNMRESAVAGIWGISAIVEKQWGHYSMLSYSGLAAILILGISIASHAYKNRYYLPFYNLKRKI